MNGRDFQAIGATRLAAQTVDAITAYAARATWPSGFAIYHRGADADGVFVVLSGRVILRNRVRAGRGFIPWIASAFETFGSEGLSATPRYVNEARADEEATTLFLSGMQFRALMREQPQHAAQLMAQVLAERSQLLEKLRELTTMSVEQRLVVSLARMAGFDDVAAENGRIALTPARYRLLCELVGATRESVSLVLGRLTGEGVIERQGNLLTVHADRLTDRLERLPLDDLLPTSTVMSGNGAVA